MDYLRLEKEQLKGLNDLLVMKTPQIESYHLLGLEIPDQEYAVMNNEQPAFDF